MRSSIVSLRINRSKISAGTVKSEKQNMITGLANSKNNLSVSLVRIIGTLFHSKLYGTFYKTLPEIKLKENIWCYQKRFVGLFNTVE